MTAFGFSITRLTLRGTDVPDADIFLENGLNVICGPSDTGKTFIAQCIDFALGKGSRPKEIEEAIGYDTVFLGLRSHESGDESMLERSFRGGQVLLHVDGEEDRVLAAKHSPNSEDTVSYYLLNLSGLAGKTVQTNREGKKRGLSFRDLGRLVLVDEQSMITEKSPILKGMHETGTTESNVFRLLLTGADASSVVDSSKSKVVRAKQEGKLEVIRQLKTEAEEEIVEKGIGSSIAELHDQLERVDASFEHASDQLGAEKDTLSTLEQRRRDAWVAVRRIDSRVNVLCELQERFALLDAQYTSDLGRLESIAEAGVRLGQLHEERCPICGALSKHHDSEHQHPDVSPDQVACACNAEAAKIRVLLEDLQGTRATNAAEIERLREKREATQSELDAHIAEIRENLRPRVREALARFRESQGSRDDVRAAILLFERRESLEELLSALETEATMETQPSDSATIRCSEAEGFAQEAERVLRSWQFPDLGRVAFSEVDQDLVIGGRSRASRGKGVRAVTHAAFNVALLGYCRSLPMPHPGFVLLDSPLVVYREPDVKEEGFSRKVKSTFYWS
ncbi:MAG: hypothetical protein HQ559_14650, partial [Lentisphaerae bacterium]|nr:hypothetical protein [Lentisphaerota bacterium]